MKTRLTVLTNSQMRTYRRCAREHHYAYELGYRAKEDAESLRFGTLIHVGREALWLGKGVDAAISAAVVGAADEYEAAKVGVLMAGYDARWGAEYHDQVVSVEREFRAPLVNPLTGAASRTFVLGGKMDVLLRDRFVEHKTTSEDIGQGSTYWQRLQMDSQVSTYYAGAKSLGHEVHGCVYDVIKKPGIRPAQTPVYEDGAKVVLDANGARVRTANGKKWRETGDAERGYVLQTRPETAEEYAARLADDVADKPGAYYQRGEVVRLEREEYEAQLDAWQTAYLIRDADARQSWPRNPDACHRYGRMCSYFAVCTGQTTLEDESRYQHVDNVHAELSSGESAAAE